MHRLCRYIMNLGCFILEVLFQCTSSFPLRLCNMLTSRPTLLMLIAHSYSFLIIHEDTNLHVPFSAR